MKHRKNILIGIVFLLLLIPNISFAGEIDYPVPCKIKLENHLIILKQ